MPAPTTEELLQQADQLIEAEKYQEVIDLLPDALLAERQNIGLIIKRVMAYYSIKEYKKAISDCDKVLALKPNYDHAFHWRAYVKAKSGDHVEAIKDYNQAIKFNTGNANLYNNRGISRRNEGIISKAIDDFKCAILKNPQLHYPYSSLGDIYYDKNEYRKALKYYKRAIEIHPNYDWAKQRINSAKARLDEKIDTELDEAVRFIIDLANTIGDNAKKRKIKKASLDVLDIMDRIRDYAHVKSPEPVVHYTKLEVANAFINKPLSNFRFYNVLYMNDPQEGKVLLEYLDKGDENKEYSINKCFEKGRLMPDGDNNVYLGSFLPAPETNDPERYSHEDELVLWRTYGKSETGEEAMGCSIVIDCDCFSAKNRYMQGLSDNDVKGPPKPLNHVIVAEVEKHALYRVLYYDKRTNKVINTEGMDTDELSSSLEQLKKKLTALIILGVRTKEERVVNQIIYRVLSELRYFFKSVDYSYEQEYRVIIYAETANERVKIDEQSDLPKKLFYDPEAQIQPYIKKIYIGPRVVNADAWKMYFEASIIKNRENAKNSGADALPCLPEDVQVLKSTTKYQ